MTRSGDESEQLVVNREVVVVADDFTGANDAGVSLAQAGMHVEVALAFQVTPCKPGRGADLQQRQSGVDGSGSRRAHSRADCGDRHPLRTALVSEKNRLHPARQYRRGSRRYDASAAGNGGRYRPGISPGRADHPQRAGVW